MKTNKKDSNTKKPYQKPKLTKWGSLKDFTQAMSATGGADPTTPGTKKMCLSQPPEIEEHRYLVGDKTSNEGMRAEIEKLVERGDRVVDLGAGTGILSFFAVDAGASHVDAIEMRPIIRLAKRAAEQNGFSDKITFHACASEDLELEQKADVLVSNLGFLNTLVSLPDAIRRHLKPGGKFFPTALQLELAPIDVSGIAAPYVSFWKQNHHGYDFSAFVSMAEHPFYQNLDEKKFLCEPVAVEPIRLAAEMPDRFNWSFQCKVERDGTMAGLAGYYNFYSGETCYISQAPPNELDPNMWGGWVLPLTSPAQVKAGDIIDVQLEYMLTNTTLMAWKISLNGKLVGDHSNIGSLWPVN